MPPKILIVNTKQNVSKLEFCFCRYMKTKLSAFIPPALNKMNFIWNSNYQYLHWIIWRYHNQNNYAIDASTDTTVCVCINFSSLVIDLTHIEKAKYNCNNAVTI